MTTPRTHMEHPDGAGVLRQSLCAMFAVEMTTEPEQVTCKLCRRRMAAQPPPEEPFVPSGPHEPRQGCREALQLRTDVVRPTWLSETQALRELVDAEDDGFRQKSSSDPTRFEPRGSGGSPFPRGDLGQRQVERLDAVWRAREQAFDGPFVVQDLPRIEIPREWSLRILEWRTVGRRRDRRIPGRKHTIADRTEVQAEDIARQLTEELLARISTGVVERVAREGRRAMRHHLRERGLLPQFVRRETEAGSEGSEMAEGTAEYPWDLEGWDEIADFLNRPKRTIQRLANRTDDPLPVKGALGRVVAMKEELERWLKRQIGPRPRRKQQETAGDGAQ